LRTSENNRIQGKACLHPWYSRPRPGWCEFQDPVLCIDGADRRHGLG